jgi:hypothetical protein
MGRVVVNNIVLFFEGRVIIIFYKWYHFSFLSLIEDRVYFTVFPQIFQVGKKIMMKINIGAKDKVCGH